MESIAVPEIRREIIYCANHREASAVSKFLADYLEVRGRADRLTIDSLAPAKGSHAWRVDIVAYETFDAFTFLAPACDRGSNHE